MGGGTAGKAGCVSELQSTASLTAVNFSVWDSQRTASFAAVNCSDAEPLSTAAL